MGEREPPFLSDDWIPEAAAGAPSACRTRRARGGPAPRRLLFRPRHHPAYAPLRCRGSSRPQVRPRHARDGRHLSHPARRPCQHRRVRRALGQTGAPSWYLPRQRPCARQRFANAAAQAGPDVRPRRPGDGRPPGAGRAEPLLLSLGPIAWPAARAAGPAPRGTDCRGADRRLSCRIPTTIRNSPRSSKNRPPAADGYTRLSTTGTGSGAGSAAAALR